VTPMNAEVRSMKTAAEQSLSKIFSDVKTTLAGGPQIAACRERAFQEFEARGLPHRRVEAWKYTDLRALMRDAKPLTSPSDAVFRQRAAAAITLDGVDARKLVFIDGFFVRELSDIASLEAGLKISSLADALARAAPEVIERITAAGPATGDAVFTINTALMQDGAVIELEAGARIARPIQLVFCYSSDKAAMMAVRSLVVLGRGAHLTLIDSHEGPDGVEYQSNCALDLHVGDEARLDHVKILSDGMGALHISTLMAEVGKNASFRDCCLTTGGALVRNQFFVHCAGAGSSIDLRNANLVKGTQHVDTTLVVDHAVAGCHSREIFKSVLEDTSKSVFQGKIIVRENAQKTDARMMSRALLLSETAESNSKPELEIFADDVQCGHGATSGDLDEELKFYLMARGIPAQEAEALLIQSFIGEVFDVLEVEPLKAALADIAADWLQARGRGRASCGQ
jgi:Fe-S cluster assembly protein SufD